MSNFGDERLPSRFWNKVIPEPNSGCWLWIGSTDTGGYGQLGIGSRTDNTRTTVRAHRVSYITIIGLVPDGLELDHRCRTRCCVNPDHLRPMTHAENIAVGDLPAHWERTRTKPMCKNGHPLSGDNLYSYNGERRCRACTCRAKKKYRAKKQVQL